MSYGDHLRGDSLLLLMVIIQRKAAVLVVCISAVVVREKKSCFALACLLNLDMCSGLMLFSGSDYV